MTSTRLTVTALSTASAAFMTLALSAPAQANTNAPGCTAASPTTTDVAAVVAHRKAEAARYAVDHAAELAAGLAR